jgi:hypothetical protein
MSEWKRANGRAYMLKRGARMCIRPAAVNGWSLKMRERENRYLLGGGMTIEQDKKLANRHV